MSHKPTVSILEQAQVNAEESPIMQRLCGFFNSYADEIILMQETMPPDEILYEFISNVFGIMGGGGSEEGWYEYAGGHKPRLEIKDRNFVVLQKLEGHQLVSAFRNLFHIPENGQLNLF